MKHHTDPVPSRINQYCLILTNPLLWPNNIDYRLILTQYHQVPTLAVLYWHSTQLHHLVTHSWANWVYFLFVFVFGGLLGLPSCVIEQFVFWCSLKKNPTQKDYNFSGISSLALDPYFREIHQDKFRSLVTTLLQSSLLSWMRITVAGDLNGDKKMGKSI